MKALTFTEFFKAYEGEEMSLLSETNWSESLAKHLKTLQKYHDFVSQDFRPELIEELFDRFDWKVNNNNCYKIQGVLFDFSEKSSYEVSFVKNKTVSKVWFLVPKTLNDFISDCSRAGIELTWKEGVWE